MADLTISVDIDASGTKRGGEAAKSAIKGIGDEAEKAGRKVKSVAELDMSALKKQMDSAGAAVQQMASSMGTLAGGMAEGLIKAGPLGIAIAALGVALLGAAAAAYSLAKNFVDYAKEIGNANKETGVSVQILSALKFGVESTGGSFSGLVSGIKEFEKTIGDANEGSKEASAKLVRLGIDGQKAATDIDGALKQVLLKIASLPTGVQQSTAAMDAFGESGTKLLPMLSQYGGNIDELIAKSKELGLTMSNDDVKAAAEFEKSLNEIKATAAAVGIAFGRELADPVKQALGDINQSLRGNQGAVQAWAEYVANTFKSLVLQVQQEVNDLRALGDLLGILNPFQSNRDWEKNFDNLGNRELEAKRIEIARANIGKPTYTNPQEDEYALYQAGRLPYATTPYNQPGPGKLPKVPKVPKVKIPKQTEEEKQAIAMQAALQNLRAELQFFGKDTEVASVEQKYFGQVMLGNNGAIRAQMLAVAALIDKKKHDAEIDVRKAEALKIFNKSLAEVTQNAQDSRVALGATYHELKSQLELGRELSDVERQRIANTQELIQKELELTRAGFSVAKAKEIVDRLKYEQDQTMLLIENIQALKEKIAVQQMDKALAADMAAEIADLNAQLRENSGLTALTRVETLLLSDAYKQLTPEMQKARLEQAQQIDILRETIKAQQEAQRQWDEMFGVIRDSLGVLAEQGFGAFFKNILRKFQQFSLDLVSAWLTSKLFQVFGQNGGILGVLMGNGSGTGTGPGGTPNWNPGSGTIAVPPPGTTPPPPGSGSGSPFTLFGSGLTNGIGTAASLGMIAGGAIGGRVGGAIQSIAGGALTGLMLGAKFGAIGGPWGAAIGAAAGFAISVIGGLFSSPKRSRDKKEKMPQLQKGFLDAITQLKALAADKNAILSNPSGALAKADELRAAIAAGFGIQFESKKYGKIAQQQIAQKLAEADVLVKQIKEFAEMSRAANERERRMLPEFAGGVYMSPAFMSFRRRNGMLGGQFTGRDTIPAMLAAGEAVLNPRQMAAINRNAGFDVIKTAGIPGYASGAVMPASFAGQPSSVQMGDVNVTVMVEQDAAGLWHATAQSDAGQKVIAKVVTNGFLNDEIKTKRRGG